MNRKTALSLAFNILYAVANCITGFAMHSWWFVTLGAYYSVLTVSRFSVLQVYRKSKGDADLETFAEKITGIMLVTLSVCLIGIITLSAVEKRGSDFHEIVMIAIATYTFTKVTLAIIGLFKVKNTPSPIQKTLRNISFADAFVSIYSMQRSMLVSFEGMAQKDIQLLNILTGTAVWLLLILLGINLIGGRCVDMAKSKIVKANEKIAEAVVGGYKKIEKGVVDGYSKIEDKFIDTYLTKDGETVEDAKKRLKKQDK